jgi:hypothetical protein
MSGRTTISLKLLEPPPFPPHSFSMLTLERDPLDSLVSHGNFRSIYQLKPTRMTCLDCRVSFIITMHNQRVTSMV